MADEEGGRGPMNERLVEAMAKELNDYYSGDEDGCPDGVCEDCLINIRHHLREILSPLSDSELVDNQGRVWVKEYITGRHLAVYALTEVTL